MVTIATDPTKSSLSPAAIRLLELMQRVNYGRIEDIPIYRGEPILDPPPRVIREIKFGADNAPRAELYQADFALKAPVRELFSQLETLRDGTVRSIEIQRGLPFRMTIEEASP